MKNLKDFEVTELITKIKNKEISAGNLIDNNICPTCFNKEHDACLYGKNDDKMLYEDDDLECFLVSNPRANGHTTI